MPTVNCAPSIRVKSSSYPCFVLFHLTPMEEKFEHFDCRLLTFDATVLPELKPVPTETQATSTTLGNVMARSLGAALSTMSPHRRCASRKTSTERLT